MRTLLIGISFFLVLGKIYSQNNKSYHDFNTNKYGVKNKHTKKIIIEPKFERILNLNDSLIAIQNKKYEYGVIDYSEKTIISFSKFPVFIDTEDSSSLRFLEMPPYSSKQHAIYYIDTLRNCLPTLEYPCPYWKNVVIDSLSSILKSTQKAIYYKSINKIDTALKFSDSCIILDARNPFVFLNWTKILLFDKDGNFIEKNKSLTVSLIFQIDSFLNLSSRLTNDSVLKINIHNIKYSFYRYIIKDKNRMENERKSNRNLNGDEINYGLYTFIGFNYFKNKEFEIGFGNGLITKQTHFNFKNYVQDGLLWIGTSYSRDFENKIDGYKLHFLSFIKPVSAGIYPILYTNYKNTDFVLRPEIGLGLNYFTFNIGYNFILNKNKYFDGKINKFCVSIRYYLPLHTRKSLIAK